MATSAPSFERELLAAWEAGEAAGEDRAVTRRDNPHQGDEPGELALYQAWLDGFNAARLPAGP
jgi:hypothetical protein